MFLYYFLGFMYTFLWSLVKRGLLTLVGEISRCRNEHCDDY